MKTEIKNMDYKENREKEEKIKKLVEEVKKNWIFEGSEEEKEAMIYVSVIEYLDYIE